MDKDIKTFEGVEITRKENKTTYKANKFRSFFNALKVIAPDAEERAVAIERSLNNAPEQYEHNLDLLQEKKSREELSDAMIITKRNISNIKKLGDSYNGAEEKALMSENELLGDIREAIEILHPQQNVQNDTETIETYSSLLNDNLRNIDNLRKVYKFLCDNSCIKDTDFNTFKFWFLRDGAVGKPIKWIEAKQILREVLGEMLTTEKIDRHIKDITLIAFQDKLGKPLKFPKPKKEVKCLSYDIQELFKHIYYPTL